jgi:hypothetical protein
MRKKKPASPSPTPDPSPAAADAPSADEVYQLFSAVMALGERLPGAALSPARQHALSGHLFSEAPLLVSQVARARAGRAELFEDAPLDPAALLERQRRALAWECLQGGLLSLARRAGSLFIQDQAAAVCDAMTLVEQVRADALRPFPHPRAQERQQAMAQAEQVLADRQARKRRAAARATPPADGRKGRDPARSLLREEVRQQQARAAASLLQQDDPPR